MSARVLDGRHIARQVREDLKRLALVNRQQFGEPAGLAIVRVGGDPASARYAQSLARAAEAIGVRATAVDLPDSLDEAGLRASLEALNEDEAIHGVLMQLPLPPHLSQRVVAETLDPRKDVDGISLRSAGSLFLRQPSFVPSTCAAVLEILDRSEIAIAGERAVVVGASNVVGKPLAFMLLHRDATVTVSHSATRDLAAQTRAASILVVAVGKPGLITADMVRPGATVVDVGTTVTENGELAGDVDYAAVSQVAGAITPVPGGVGQLTNLMLLKQTLLAQAQDYETLGPG
jgi:methylenetetrahydrofolate dehydrogenase (NADP+)/methenyltetrahydrofolate cyclohydrolase